MGIVTLVDKGGYSFSDHYVYVTNPSNFAMPNLNGSPLVDHQASYFKIATVTVTLSGDQSASYVSNVTTLFDAKFGAELRSIGSANVYGNYGAVADGDETLMYLVSHNFAYIGTGAEDRNDIDSVIQANEVLESNNGHIYYESIDQVGNFRIGDIFYVEQSTGVVTFDAQSIDFLASGNITLEGPTSTTIINATKVQTGNIKIYDNNIDSLSGPVNFLAQSGTTTLNTDVNVTGNLDVTGSIYVDGNVFLGDNPLDTVTIVPYLTQTIEPDQTNYYSLGNNTGPKIWNTLFLSTELNIDNITSISSNTITTLSGAADLRLVAAGSGIINVTTTDVEITNDLTVNGTPTNSQFADIGITGLLDITGDWNPTGAVDRTGDTDITGTLTVNGVHTIDIVDVEISSNTITTTATDTDLEFSANGLTSLVKTLTSNVEITNNLEVLTDSDFNVTNVTTVVEATTFTVGDIDITANSITTHAPNINLVLSADGNGEIHVKTTDVVITNDLEVNGTVTDSQLVDVGITGLLDITGDWEPTGAVDRTGDTDITGTLTVNGANTVQFEDIQVVGNTVTTTVGNNDLELSANGVASLVKSLTSDVEITQNLDVLLDGEFGSASVTLGVTLTDIDTTGFVTLTTTQEAQNVSGTSTPTGFFFYGWADDPGQINPPFSVIQVGWSCVQIPGSVVTAVGDGVTDYNITISGGSFVSGVSYSFTGNVVTSGIHIVDNTISTTTADTNLQLKAFTGQKIHFVTSDVSIANDLTIAGPATFNGDSTLLSVEIDGDTEIVGDLNQTVGDTYITGNFNNNNILIESPSYIELSDIKIDDNIISVTTLDTDLEFRANGTGGVVFDRQLKINTNIISNIFDVNDLSLSFNNLYLTEDDQLLLTEDGDNYLLDLKNDRDLSVIFQPNGIGNVIINSTKAIAVAYGNATDRTLEYLGEIRQNSTNKRYEGFTPNGLVSFSNIFDTDGNTYITPELTPGVNDNTLRFAINNVVTTRVTETEMFSNRLTVDNVTISGTTVNNLNSTADLILSGNGTGNTVFNTVGFNGNDIVNTENTALILSSTGTGYVKFTGTAGIVLPIGDDASRSLTPEIAEIRYNSDRGYVEIYSGTEWSSLRGSAATATEEEVAAETNLWAFVLG
jgi:hypothetical protein